MKRKRLVGLLTAIIDEFDDDDDILLTICVMNQSGNPEVALSMKEERKRHFRLGHLTMNLNE